MGVESPVVMNDEIVEVTLVQRMDAQMILNTLHYKVADAGTDGTIQGLAEQLWSEYTILNGLQDRMRQNQTKEIEYLGMRAQVIYPARKVYWFVRATTAYQPTNADQALPSNVTAVITKRTDTVGKKQHGDFFIAGLAADSVKDSLWKSGTLDELEAIGDKLVEDVNTLACRLIPIIYHPGTGPHDNSIMQCYPQPECRVLRRRTVGRGK